ncbi:NAD(+) diphosphatase [Nesterenkonia lutea]|uniref:NAD(+) diphosphatase n=1 Tax=Nesterenkonia lutea TaxID=272919 RepID=A0ABR9JF56_9MICC|nr:NAD(+) diphosphatase [Nesterenkonia lutea]MBE1524554.1 NAD+ diphosphatase [Nesterenkonia lutea]
MHMRRRDPGDSLLTLPQDGARIDRLDAERKRPEWLSEVWATPGTRVLNLYGRRAKLSGNRLSYEPALGELPAGAVTLGAVDATDLPADLPGDLPGGLPGDSPQGQAAAGTRVHVVTVAHPQPTEEADPAQTTGTTWADLAFAGSQLTPVDAALLTQALAITTWHARSAFCAACGTATEVEVSGWMRRCPNCGSQTFPRTDPAVITAVLDTEDRLLLGSAHRWDTRRFSTFAGFVEAGESVEAALAREIEEEAGVVVSDIQYMGSQSWPFPRSLMLGHFAVTSDPSAARPDGEEIREVRWFTREQLAAEAAAGVVSLPTRSSISRALIEHWHGGPLEAASDAQPSRTGAAGRPAPRGQQAR